MSAAELCFDGEIDKLFALEGGYIFGVVVTVVVSQRRYTQASPTMMYQVRW